MEARLVRQHAAAYRIIHHLSNRPFVQDFVDRANPQDIADVAWSLAKLRRPYHMRILLSVMDNNDQYRNAIISDEKPQHITNIIWACAKLGQLKTAMELRADWLAANGSHQDIANTAWAFATLNHKSNALLAAIEKRSDWVVTNGLPQSIANTARAFATLNHPSPSLFTAIENRSDWLVAHGNPQEISSTAGLLPSSTTKRRPCMPTLKTDPIGSFLEIGRKIFPCWPRPLPD